MTDGNINIVIFNFDQIPDVFFIIMFHKLSLLLNKKVLGQLKHNKTHHSIIAGLFPTHERAISLLAESLKGWSR